MLFRSVSQSRYWGGPLFGPRYHTPKIAAPEFLWVEPNTGVVMMKPSYMWAGYEEDDALKNAVHLAKNRLEYPSDHITFAGPEPGSDGRLLAITKRTTGSIVGLVSDIATAAVLAGLSTTMSTVLRSVNSFGVNEGIAVLVTSFGTATDRGENFCLITFGDRYALGINLS